MKKIIRFIAVTLVLFFSSGCATTLVREGSHDMGVYPATQTNAAMFFMYPPLSFLNLVDLPFSIITDTLYLPADTNEIIKEHKLREESKKKTSNQAIKRTEYAGVVHEKQNL